MTKVKVENSFDFLRGREKTRVSIFYLRNLSPVLFEAGSEIHIIVTYDHETNLYVNTKNLDDRFGGN